MTDNTDFLDTPASADDARIDALVAAAHPPLTDDAFDRLLDATTADVAHLAQRPTGRRRLVLSLVAAAAVIAAIAITAVLLREPRQVVLVQREPAADPFTLWFGPADGSTMTAQQRNDSVPVLFARMKARGITAGVISDGTRIGIQPQQRSDADEIVRLVSRVGRIQFRPVIAAPVPVAPGSLGPGLLDVASAPDDQNVRFRSEPDDTGAYVAYALGPSRLGNDAIEAGRREDSTGTPAVRLTFHSGPEGIDRFNALAADCFGQTPSCPQGLIAIVVDGTVVGAPRINDPSYGRDLAGTRYSPLKQINANNVVDLRQAWSFPLDASGADAPSVASRHVDCTSAVG